MTAGNDNLSFMNGVPELLILHLLGQKEMYGYEIVRAIGASTGQVIAVGEGCVYPILHALEKKQWLSTRRLARDGRQRIYYRLTESGRRRLEQSSARWSEFSSAVSAALRSPHVQPPIS
jgi:PadR family transcriptional regulator, regulatory protein PadR